MKNTLKITLILIGIGLIGYGAYLLFSGQTPPETVHQNLEDTNSYTQSLAMIAFGVLCLVSGIAFKRRRKK